MGAPMMTRPLTLADEARPTPQATIDALMYALRGGLAAFDDPSNLDRLRRCYPHAMRQVATRLQDWKGKRVAWLPVWPDDDIETLVKLWAAVRGKA